MDRFVPVIPRESFHRYWYVALTTFWTTASSVNGAFGSTRSPGRVIEAESR